MVKRVIDLANPGGWIARKTLFAFANMLVWGNSVDRDYTKEFKKVGEKVIIRKRVQFDAIDGVATGGSIVGAIQPIDERNAVLTVNANPIVAFDATDRDMALSIEDFYDRYIVEAAIKLANMAELAIARAALKFSNAVGTPGVTPDDFDAMAAAAEVLDNMSVPRDEMRSLIITPKTNRKLSGNLAEQFNPQISASNAQRKGIIGEGAGFAVLMSQIGPSHQDAVQDGTGQVDGGDQVGNVISLKGFTPGDALKANAIITFGGVYAVNRYTKDTVAALMQFRVTALATADGSGEMNVFIDPPMEIEGPYQNVTNAAIDGAAVTVDTYGPGGPVLSPCNFAFHKNAMAVATIPLMQPKGFDISEVVSYKGWTLRFVRGFELGTGNWTSRMELMFAVDVLEPTAGVRVLG